MSTLTESSLSQDISGFHTFSPNSPASGSSSPHYGYSSYGRTPKFGKSSKKSPSNHKTLGYYSHNISPQTTPLKSDQSENYAYEYGLVNGYYYYFDGITFYGVPAPSSDENRIIEENKNNSPVKNNPEPPSTPIPLQNSWSFWFDKYLGPGLTLSEYETAMKNLGSFSTVQEFWKYYNNIPAASRLPPRTSYHMMKTGIKPLWEDESNMYGGSFSFRIPKEISDVSWLHTLLAVIGEQFDEGLNTDGGDDVCGVSISRRREENVINVWHKTASLADKEKFSNFICKILSRVSPGFIPVVNYKVHQSEENFKSQSSPASK